MHDLGLTRSALGRDHLLQTPDTFVRTGFPGLRRGEAIIHIGPAAGAAFTQYTAELSAQGELDGLDLDRFVYVLSGSMTLAEPAGQHELTAGGFAFIPAEVSHRLRASEPSRINVIERRHRPSLAGSGEDREVLVGSGSAVASAPLLDDERVTVRSLLPSGMDFAVNLMTYLPGAALSMVEVHIMEHGLLMLEGGGIYRLGNAWYPVNAGDFIWMAPFCPQWFGALGRSPATYLIYKDTDQHPFAR